MSGMRAGRKEISAPGSRLAAESARSALASPAQSAATPHRPPVLAAPKTLPGASASFDAIPGRRLHTQSHPTGQSAHPKSL